MENIKNKFGLMIGNAIKKLQVSGYVIEADTVETILGKELTHIYLKGKDNKGKIYEQKHLFTLDN